MHIMMTKSKSPGHYESDPFVPARHNDEIHTMVKAACLMSSTPGHVLFA